MIAYLGISHLSLCYSAAALKKGFKVCIFDFKDEVERYNFKKDLIFEPGLQNIQKKFKNNFNITYNFSFLKNAKIIFLSKDVKTDVKNNVEYHQINKLIKKAKNFSNKKLLVVMCQVEAGFTRRIKWKKKIHYVETLVFGNAINRALNPERIIVGKENKNVKINKFLISFLKKFTPNIIELTFEESELCKAFINIYLANQLTTTNTLNEIANKFKARWSKIQSALKLDARIGSSAYLTPGLGISGGNIERDIKTLKRLSIKKKINETFFSFLENKSDYFKSWIVKECRSANKIGIIGMTYKQDSKSIKNSPQLFLMSKLKNKLFYIFDKRLNNLDFPLSKFFFTDLQSLIKKVDCLAIFHDLKEIKKVPIYKFRKIKKIIDPYSILFNKRKNFKSSYKNLFE